MKLKASILAISLILGLNALSDQIKFNWKYKSYQTANNLFATEKHAETKEIAKKLAVLIFPVGMEKPNGLSFNSKVSLLEYISTNIVKDISVTYEGAPKNFILDESFNITNIVTGEYIDRHDIYSSESEAYLLVKQAFLLAQKSSIGIRSILKENSVFYVANGSTYLRVHISLEGLLYNVLNSSEAIYNEMVISNFEKIKNYLSSYQLEFNDLKEIGLAIEENQLKEISLKKASLDLDSSITNLLHGISLNSYYAAADISVIKTVAKTFAQDQRIKQLASGQIFSTLNPTDEGDEGVIYDALDQLVRLNMLKQGNNITESELNTMSSSDKWTNSGMAAKYGSYADNYNNRNIGIIVGSEAIKENENFQNKVNTLSQLSDANGNLVDPLTGELTKLTNAIREWDKSKVDGALASYSYNNPAATNGFFGAIKRNLTEEGDWRLLDNKHKDKEQSFMDNITQSGIKINTSTGPVHVELNQNQPIAITLPEDIFSSKSIKTYDANTAALYQNWLDWRVLWSNSSGVENHNDRGYLDIMLERNDYFYSFVTNNMYSNFSNQLSRLIELNEVTNKSTFVDIPTSTYVRYLRRGIGTVENNDDELFAIKDEPTFNHDGSTNFEQAVVYQLNDLFNVMQNGSKADMMSADFIRGIYRVLGTGSNLVSQLEYITNTVYQANGISTDSESYAVYGESLEELENNLSDVNETISEIHRQSKERIDSVVLNLFADYTLPNKLVLLEFNGQRFEINLNKYADVFHMIHACASVAWLTIALLLLPRVIYMVLCFSLRMLAKFYGIMRS